jgi:hypothetical protein
MQQAILNSVVAASGDLHHLGHPIGGFAILIDKQKAREMAAQALLDGELCRPLFVE